MLNFVWWFAVGPLIGWLSGKLMRSGHNGWLDALAGMVGAVVFGILCEMVGFNVTNTSLDAAVAGAAGAMVVTFIFAKAIASKSDGLPRQSGTRSSYTSYKSRMGK
jgi:uncharacterized membrane protein YeaQ/YmgE (transglycosylase-associated protein family)